MKILDLGCGPHKTPGAWGIDAYPYPGVDQVHNLDVIPWPVESGGYDLILVRHILEHVQDPVAMLREIHRAAKPNATVDIVTPHFSNRCAYVDLTHRRALSVRALDFFTGSESLPLARRKVACNWLFQHRFVYETWPEAPRFTRTRLHLTFSRLFQKCGFDWLFNRHPDFYEFYLAWIFPARDIEFTLRAIKE